VSNLLLDTLFPYLHTYPEDSQSDSEGPLLPTRMPFDSEIDLPIRADAPPSPCPREDCDQKWVEDWCRHANVVVLLVGSPTLFPPPFHSTLIIQRTECIAVDHCRDFLFALLLGQPIKPTRNIGILPHTGPEVLWRFECRRHYYHHRPCSDVVLQAARDLCRSLDVRAVACKFDNRSRLCCVLDVATPVDPSIRDRGSVALRVS
jgi:hypothetical protein